MSLLSYRWAIPVHSEVVFLHRSARLLIRCLRRVPSEQENISFFYAGFFVFFFLQMFLYSFFLNASLVEALTIMDWLEV